MPHRTKQSCPRPLWILYRSRISECPEFFECNRTVLRPKEHTWTYHSIKDDTLFCTVCRSAELVMDDRHTCSTGNVPYCLPSSTAVTVGSSTTLIHFPLCLQRRALTICSGISILWEKDFHCERSDLFNDRWVYLLRAFGWASLDDLDRLRLARYLATK